MSATTDIAGFLWDRYGRLSLDDVPARALRVATHCMLDWLGCAAAGSREPLTQLLRDELASEHGTAPLIGSDLRATPTVAALINGAAGHALDYDDTSSFGHPTAPVLPAVLAVAQERGLSGAALLSAFIAGFEVENRVALLCGSAPYLNGWHTTPLYGVFGAAAGVSHLLQLDGESFGCALGLAASQASGVKANFGTMTKPFHAGHAAERGCLSARLAARGFSANAASLQGNQGLLQALGVGNQFVGQLEERADDWFVTKTLFKYHAACYLTHASIINMHKALGEVGADQVETVTLLVNPTILDVCGLYDKPQTGLEAKFSLTGTAAMALCGVDTSDPRVFNEAVVCEPRLQSTLARVRIETDSTLTTMQAQLRLATSDGRVIEHASDTGIPAEDLDAQEAALIGKFIALSTPALGEGRAASAERILNVAGQRDTAALLR